MALFLQILVEFDDDVWDTREWINVYKDNQQLIAVEQTLVLGNRNMKGADGNVNPALVR